MEIFMSEKELDNGEFRCSNCVLNDICETHELSCPFQEVKSLEQHDRELLEELEVYKRALELIGSHYFNSELYRTAREQWIDCWLVQARKELEDEKLQF